LTETPSCLAFKRLADGISLWIHVTPRAPRERVGGARGDALRVAVREPPVAGEANAACARALATALGVPRSAVVLAPAAKGRRKRVRVTGDPQALEQALARLAAGAAIR